MSPPIQLPIVTVQHDFDDVISDVRDGILPSESFWLSCYKTGEPSVHGKVHASLDDRDRNLVRFENHGGVEFKHNQDVSTVNYASCCRLNWHRSFKFPRRSSLLLVMGWGSHIPGPPFQHNPLPILYLSMHLDRWVLLDTINLKSLSLDFLAAKNRCLRCSS